MLLSFSLVFVINLYGQDDQPTLKLGVYTIDDVDPVAIESVKADQLEKAQQVMNDAYNSGAAPQIKILLEGHHHLLMKEAITGETTGSSVIPSMSLAHSFLFSYVDNAEYLFRESSSSAESWGIERQEVDRTMVSSLYASPDIAVFIVDDEFYGNPYFFVDNAVGNLESYDFSLFALIKESEFVDQPYALALAIFGLLGDSSVSHANTDGVNSSLLSYFSYYFPINGILGADLWNPTSLGDINKCLVKKSLHTLQLRSLDRIGISNGVSNGKRKFVAAQSVVFQPDEVDATEIRPAKRLRTSESDDYVTMQIKYLQNTPEVPGVCPIRNGIVNLTRQFTKTDVDSVKVSGAVDAEEAEQKFQKTVVYPNPFTNQFNIRFGAEGQSNATLYVFDMQGREMVRQQYDLSTGASVHEIQFDATDLNMGMYVYRLQVGESVHSGTIIKEYKR